MEIPALGEKIEVDGLTYRWAQPSDTEAFAKWATGNNKIPHKDILASMQANAVQSEEEQSWKNTFGVVKGKLLSCNAFQRLFPTMRTCCVLSPSNSPGCSLRS